MRLVQKSATTTTTTTTNEQRRCRKFNDNQQTKDKRNDNKQRSTDSHSECPTRPKQVVGVGMSLAEVSLRIISTSGWSGFGDALVGHGQQHAGLLDERGLELGVGEVGDEAAVVGVVVVALGARLDGVGVGGHDVDGRRRQLRERPDEDGAVDRAADDRLLVRRDGDARDGRAVTDTDVRHLALVVQPQLTNQPNNALLHFSPYLCLNTGNGYWDGNASYCSGATFSKVPRKILGKLLILGATDTQVATSSRGYSATVEHSTNRPINSVQRSNTKLCSSSSSSNSSSKIRSFPKIFLGTFENAAPVL